MSTELGAVDHLHVRAADLAGQLGDPGDRRRWIDVAGPAFVERKRCGPVCLQHGCLSMVCHT